MKRAALYARVSTVDQNPDNQLLELRALAQQRGFEIFREYVDHGVSGTRTRRPGLDAMMADASRGRFQVVMVWAVDRLARSVKHFLDVLAELNRLQIEFLSVREAMDTSGALGKAIIVIVSVIAELERSLIIERVKLGMKRAKLEGRQIGRRPIAVDRVQLVRDREHGRSLTEIAKAHGISRALVSRILKEEKSAGHKGVLKPPLQSLESERPESAA